MARTFVDREKAETACDEMLEAAGLLQGYGMTGLKDDEGLRPFARLALAKAESLRGLAAELRADLGRRTSTDDDGKGDDQPSLPLKGEDTGDPPAGGAA